MSFLNPVSEPVLRFSSTDANAPQINYNARVAGDVKAVLKACLVTGYGSKSGAGWSITGETSTIAEFVSPSSAMIDYRLGIDDTSASSTTWYYRYQNSRVNPTGNSVDKNKSSTNNTSALNSWDLLVTAQGIYFIQNIVMSAVSAVVSSVTYWGKMKSAVITQEDSNIAWWCLGYNSSTPFEGRTPDFFSAPINSAGKYYSINALSISGYAHPAIELLKTYDPVNLTKKISAIDVAAEWFLVADRNIVAQQPGVLLRSKNDAAVVSPTGVGVLNDRPIFTVWVGRTASVSSQVYAGSTVDVLIYLDYWEY